MIETRLERRCPKGESLEPLIRVLGLKKYFHTAKSVGTSRTEIIKAVDGISFDIFRGESFGLVGESGSGKSTTGRCVLGLMPALGHVYFDGRDILALKEKELRRLRRKMQIIFQDPFSSLDPASHGGPDSRGSNGHPSLVPGEDREEEKSDGLVGESGYGKTRVRR